MSNIPPNTSENTADVSIPVPQKQENIWLNLGFNIVVPSVLLIKGKDAVEYFGCALASVDLWIFIIALLFPLVYGIYDLIDRKKWNILSIIGIASVALTGGIGLLNFSRECMIVKETAVPLVLGVVVLATAFTKRPLAKMIMLNESVVNVHKIDASLDEKGTRDKFDDALKFATYLVAASFLISAVLNFFLASYIFKSDPGTPEFNKEVGEMLAFSYPVIVLPTSIIFIFAMYKFFKAITSCTGLPIEDIIAERPKK